MAAAHNDIFTKTIGALQIDMVKKCVDKLGTESEIGVFGKHMEYT